ncbi:telomere repeat binding factor-domain-containing protein [Cladorrhinum samala]|uniref:Telomere repeat binding factor-domain-containing protein n=1 Tax=Cladorrhinum samala TaxID=585594 RepID=A0AAV9HC56_9PEZI|nr:telomere repeat binding factor-domain-containing protein [Cladorrhinum samala]
MADGSQLEADLLAALQALPEPDKAAPAQNDVSSPQPQQQQQQQQQSKATTAESQPVPSLSLSQQQPQQQPQQQQQQQQQQSASQQQPIPATTTPATTMLATATAASPANPSPPPPPPPPLFTSNTTITTTTTPTTAATATPLPSTHASSHVPAPTPISASPPTPTPPQYQQRAASGPPTIAAAAPPHSPTPTVVPRSNSIATSFAPDTHILPEANLKLEGSPSIQFAQIFAPSQPTSSNVTSRPPESITKRSRSPDLLDHSANSPKRVKTVPAPAKTKDNAADKGQESSNLDFEAMLNNALADLDQHARDADGDTAMHGVKDLPATVNPPAPDPANTEFEKAETKIMKTSSNSIYMMRSMSLPLLGNVAVQLLLRLSQQSRAETQALLADKESGFSKAYEALKDVFGPTRKIFSLSPLLSPDELEITDSEDRETVRISNLAATAMSAFGANDVPLKDVHDSFFAIFVPEECEYKDSLTELLVSIKTRLFWDTQKQENAPSPMELLETLFPIAFDESLKQRAGELLLNAEEERLVDRIRKRRDELVQSAGDGALKVSLEEQSSADKVVDHLSVFLQSHLGVVVDYAEKYGVNIPLSEEEAGPFPLPDVEDQERVEDDQEDSLAALLRSATSHIPVNGDSKEINTQDILQGQSNALEPELELRKLIEQSLANHDLESKDQPEGQQAATNGISDFDPKDLASFIAENLKDPLEASHGLPNNSTMPYASVTSDANHALQTQYMHTQSTPYQSYVQTSAPAPAASGAPGGNLPPNQSLPTAALYEKARQAAVAKSSSAQRREGLHSTRRPWSPEEEKALMAGLDMVKGPHWSQILGLFGPNGTISDILKDRTQVQLKDKARNLKLFFLKTNSEMPYYLQSVTGELKTRAPTQAARKEAEEKARQNLEEEQARIQSMMILGGGLHNNHHPAGNPPLAASPARRDSPATPGVSGTNGVVPITPAHSTAGGHSQPPVPISPLVKSEPSDHNSMHKVTTFPPIQPAPAATSVPGQSTQQPIKPQLPALQPQPTSSHQQHPQQVHQNQYQQPRYTQQQPTHQQQQQPQQSHQTQTAQQQSQSQPQSQPRPQSQAHIQAQTQGLANTQTAPSGQPSSLPSYQPQQSQGQAPPPTQASTSNNINTPTFNLPPMPPNHHSTPDHAQDTKLFDALQAAIASENQKQNQSHSGVAVTANGSAN